MEIVSVCDLKNRKHLTDELITLGRNFANDSDKISQRIAKEISEGGINSLLGHLRLCGAIPEKYGHDTTEEKLYSKYTDIVISESFNSMGINSIVLKERADSADVECVAKDFSFVADAKAFRLSRTAKNQKDFKIQSLDNWKRNKPYATIVCPVYQLPTRTSQIYLQAITKSVWIATYTHIAVLVRYAAEKSQNKSTQLLHSIFKTVDKINPTKDAVSYWLAINHQFLEFDKTLRNLWVEEKKAAMESMELAKQEALEYFASERERIMRLSRQEAINEILILSKIENKIKSVQSVNDNGLLLLGN